MSDMKSEPTPKKQVILVGVLGTLIILGGAMIPGLNLLLFALPVPYVQLIYKQGHSAGRQAILLTVLLNGLLMPFVVPFITLITVGLLAVVLGGALHEKLSPKRTALASVGAGMVSALVFYYFAKRVGYVADYQKFMMQHPVWTMVWGETLSPEMEKMIKEYVIDILPSIAIATGMLWGLFNHYLSAYYLRRTGHTISRLPAFKNWHYPRWIGLVWVLLNFLPADPVTMNIQVILMLILICEGASLFLFYGTKWNLYSWIQYLILLATLPLLNVVYLIIGLIDNVFQFRHIKKKV